MENPAASRRTIDRVVADLPYMGPHLPPHTWTMDQRSPRMPFL